jgi:DNA-binding response OmpR family regulator
MSKASDVLLIDDDYDLSCSIVEYFEAASVPIITVNDPRLVQSLNLETVRLILLDIDMPKLSGFDVLGTIRQRNQNLTVVMISGHNDLATRVKCLEGGADFFLSKPFDLKELLLISKRALGFETAVIGAAPCWSLYRENSSLITPDGRVFGLSCSEFRVLELLFRNKPNVVSKEDLSVAVIGKRDLAHTYSRSLEVLISRIRTRVSTTGFTLPVKALRNSGYVFTGHGEIID